MSTPPISTQPVLGESSPASIANSVDLPAPEAPTMASVSPVAHTEADIGENGQRAFRARHGFRYIPGFENDLILHRERPVKRFFVLLVLCWAAVSANAGTPVILVFGDSISAGYGLPRVEQGWVALLQAKLKNQGYGYQVVNASVSGETTAGGLARLPRALGLHHPAIVILELGGNDGLRALPVAQMRANLARMAELSARGGGEGAAAGYADAAQLRSGIHRAVRPGVCRGGARSEARHRALPARAASPCPPISCRRTASTPTSPASRNCSRTFGRPCSRCSSAERDAAGGVEGPVVACSRRLATESNCPATA